MQFRSVFLEPDGSRGTAVLEARSEQELHDTLRGNGSTLIHCRPLTPTIERRARTLPPRKLLTFTQSMESSMDAGVPVLTALTAIASQEQHPGHRRVHAGIAERVTSGSTLAEALAAFPRSFSPVYRALVRAGESSGSLPTSFGALGEFLEWREELRATIRQAMIYPAVVLTAAYALILFLLAFVIPSLGQVIAKLGADRLPPASRTLIDLSGLVANQLGLVVASSVGLVALAVAAARTPAGRALAAGVLARLPVVRGVVATLGLAQLCRTLSVLLAAGLTVIQALELGHSILSVPRLRSAAAAARERILAGAKVTDALGECELLPPVALGMVRIGEETGRLPSCFERLGRMYDREAKAAVKRALGLVEPVVTVALGLIIGGIAALVITTLYSVIGGLGR